MRFDFALRGTRYRGVKQIAKPSSYRAELNDKRDYPRPPGIRTERAHAALARLTACPSVDSRWMFAAQSANPRFAILKAEGAWEVRMTVAERFTPAFVAWMRVQSTRRSAKKCREQGVGAMIVELKAMTPENGTGEYVEGARADLQLLESFCRTCPRYHGCRSK